MPCRGCWESIRRGRSRLRADLASPEYSTAHGTPKTHGVSVIVIDRVRTVPDKAVQTRIQPSKWPKQYGRRSAFDAKRCPASARAERRRCLVATWRVLGALTDQ